MSMISRNHFVCDVVNLLRPVEFKTIPQPLSLDAWHQWRNTSHIAVTRDLVAVLAVCLTTILFEFWPQTFTVELKTRPARSEIMILKYSFPSVSLFPLQGLISSLNSSCSKRLACQPFFNVTLAGLFWPTIKSADWLCLHLRPDKEDLHLRMSQEICLGMTYLSGKNFVHRVSVTVSYLIDEDQHNWEPRKAEWWNMKLWSCLSVHVTVH